MAGFRFIFAIFTIAVVLILAVHLRNRCDRICHLVNSVNTQQGRLKQELRQKQLRLEGYISPAAVSKSSSSQ